MKNLLFNIKKYHEKRVNGMDILCATPFCICQKKKTSIIIIFLSSVYLVIMRQRSRLLFFFKVKPVPHIM
jgi:hypothetical protein